MLTLQLASAGPCWSCEHLRCTCKTQAQRRWLSAVNFSGSFEESGAGGVRQHYLWMHAQAAKHFCLEELVHFQCVA